MEKPRNSRYIPSGNRKLPGKQRFSCHPPPTELPAWRISPLRNFPPRRFPPPGKPSLNRRTTRPAPPPGKPPQWNRAGTNPAAASFPAAPAANSREGKGKQTVLPPLRRRPTLEAVLLHPPWKAAAGNSGNSVPPNAGNDPSGSGARAFRPPIPAPRPRAFPSKPRGIIDRIRTPR